MKEPRWLGRTVVLAIHGEQVTEHGGSLGLRDAGLLDSALARPRNRLHYGTEVDLLELAACYAFGIARNHPFIDGNKRVAFQSAYIFLGLNGLQVESDEVQVVEIMLGLAASAVSEEQLADWFRARVMPRE